MISMTISYVDTKLIIRLSIYICFVNTKLIMNAHVSNNYFPVVFITFRDDKTNIIDTTYPRSQ